MDYRRYSDQFFDILVAGGLLGMERLVSLVQGAADSFLSCLVAPGGSIVADEGELADYCVFSCDPDADQIKDYVSVSLLRENVGVLGYMPFCGRCSDEFCVVTNTCKSSSRTMSRVSLSLSKHFLPKTERC